ncbi:MAG: hypothetical protein ACJ8F7_16840 [Gemmataceae bacterium]
MSSYFLTLAMTSPGRQLAFRRAVVFHVLLSAVLGWLALTIAPKYLTFFGDALLVVGIVEGAALVGWRLAQLPKSQALEFLLVSPLRPRNVFLSEALVGLGRLALVTMCGLPVLLLLTAERRLYLSDLPAMLLMPWLWGAIAGLGLTVWAYERRGVRRWGERVGLLLILVYLVVGVLAAERLQVWLASLPSGAGEFFFRIVGFVFNYNPFGVLENWMSPKRDPALALERMVTVAAGSVLLLAALLTRGALRLKGHFHDRHYTPATDRRRSEVGAIGDRPLSWWAVRRVMEYSGRSNLWMAGGFGVVYAAYVVLGDRWPAWMGQMVFQIFEHLGGVPALTAGMAVLAAVPAAFQYGLWDASRQDRCKRLELLLLTRLDGTDYWKAAAAAAWRRGRGYFFVAVILWSALGIAGRATVPQVLAAAATGGLLWTFSFALGFRAFSRGVHANGLGMLLTIGLPLLAIVLIRSHIPVVASLLPVGAVYEALTGGPTLLWLAGPVLTAGLTLAVARSARRHCDAELRAWYDRNQGIKVLD